MKVWRSVCFSGLSFLSVSVAASAAASGSDGPCAQSTRNALKIAGAVPEVCVVSTKLMSDRAVVVALWDTDPDSPPEIPLAAVFDFRALEKGERQILYRRQAQGESLSSFLFEGKTTELAIADFGGKMGFAMWVMPDADYFFAITTFDPGTRTWRETVAPATDLDAKVELSGGRIRIPICESQTGPSGKIVYDLYFNVHRPDARGLGSAEKHELATSAPSSERAHCRQTVP